MNKNFKKVAIAAAGAATVLSLAVATPSFASQASNSTSSVETKKPASAKVFAAPAVLAITVTGVPSTVTDAQTAARGASFTVYPLAADATAVPSTQPTTGGQVVKAVPGTLTGTTLAGALVVKGGAAGTTTKLAVYPAAGGSAVLVTVVVNANGIATATSSAALTATYVAPVAVEKPVKGEKPADVSGSVRGDKGGKGKGGKR
jgi:hypothetical protein